MFEVTGEDVAALDDADLRTLVARLCVADLRDQGASAAAVTAGGHQDAPDGGIDVRVASDGPLARPDFVPRASTGFQAKRTDLTPAEIGREMRPDGRLRPSIGDLALAGGAYVIVSSVGSVADPQLDARRRAMRRALDGEPGGERLLTDYYDRDRLAAWVDAHPAVAAWVRARIGASTDGWHAFGSWKDVAVGGDGPFIADGPARVVEERPGERRVLELSEAVSRLRDALRRERGCTRLIGMSGLGKTRLVQALFETEVGVAPLDPAMALYADYSEETRPSAREMARRLVEEGRRAILVVDNCNPATHGELARVCSATASRVSLLTVEYDVRDDEPEGTEVLRLQPCSRETLAQWLASTFPHVLEPDRLRIAEFSDGNFRIARALAGTVRGGEALGTLRDADLFERLFRQRHGDDVRLLDDAALLSLLYSFDGEDVGATGELATLAAADGRTARDLHRAAAKLRSRGLVQARGRWRALLPQAVANHLAVRALGQLASADVDALVAALTPRMLRSLCTRIGFLHPDGRARALVARWLPPHGPLGDLLSTGSDGLELTRRIAPVAPEATLARIVDRMEGPDGARFAAVKGTERSGWLRLLKDLAYDPHTFEDAARCLARFLAAEPPENNVNTAGQPFGELFHVRLSGTHASPQQRRDLVRSLAQSDDEGLRRCATQALRALLATGGFVAFGAGDFGARFRDWGWMPRTHGEVRDWIRGAVALAVELDGVLPEARRLLADGLRRIWRHDACHDAVERAAAELSRTAPWPEAWTELRTAMRFDGERMPPASRERLAALIDRLAPKDLLAEARAHVLARHGFDAADGEDAGERAIGIGRRLAVDDAARAIFLPEAIEFGGMFRDHGMGVGMARAAPEPARLWEELAAAYGGLEARRRGEGVLGGFMRGLAGRDPHLATRLLDDAVGRPDVGAALPVLQHEAGLDESGVERLRDAYRRGLLSPDFVRRLANGSVRDVPPGPLARLLLDVADAEQGLPAALEVLWMRFHCDRDPSGERGDHHPALVEAGRRLLSSASLAQIKGVGDHALAAIARVSLSGGAGLPAAARLCATLAGGLRRHLIEEHSLEHLMSALFDVAASTALDAFVQPLAIIRRGIALDGRTPLRRLGPETLLAWAGEYPARFDSLADALDMFTGEDEGDGLEPAFVAVMEGSPDPRAFLGEPGRRLQPRSWSGSLADALRTRARSLKPLTGHPDAAVRAWAAGALDLVARRLAAGEDEELSREESFE